MTESRLFLSSCSRRELARRRTGRGHLLALLHAWSTSTPPLALAMIAALAVATVVLAFVRGPF